MDILRVRNARPFPIRIDKAFEHMAEWAVSKVMD